MKGVIDKIWENKTDEGKPYLVVRIGENKYSVWDKKYMEGLNEGAAVEYEFTQSGKFKKITDMKKIDLEPGIDPPERKPRDRNGQEIVRMSCISSAATLAADFGSAPEERAKITLGLARRFEKYVIAHGAEVRASQRGEPEGRDRDAGDSQERGGQKSRGTISTTGSRSAKTRPNYP